MKKEAKIIGIGGLPRSGKDTLAELFVQEAGYYGVSFGDIVRDVSRVRHKDSLDPISVSNMTETSNWLRGEQGPDFALKQALALYQNAIESGGVYEGLVVWSIRAPVEVDFILKHHGELIWVEASDLVRYNRAMRYLREGESKLTIAEFKAQEALQWEPQPGIPASVQMDISYVKAKATMRFVNNDDNIKHFRTSAQKLVDDLSRKTASEQ